MRPLKYTRCLKEASELYFITLKQCSMNDSKLWLVSIIQPISYTVKTIYVYYVYIMHLRTHKNKFQNKRPYKFKTCEVCRRF